MRIGVRPLNPHSEIRNPQSSLAPGTLRVDKLMPYGNTPAVTLFEKIIARQIPAKVAFEDERYIVIHDVSPQAPVHVLIIPKKVIRTHADVAPEDQAVLGHLHLVAAKLAKELGLVQGYRLVINCDEQGGQVVPHLHLHLLGGRDMTWPPG